MKNHLTIACLLVLTSACSHQAPEPVSAPKRASAPSQTVAARQARQARLAQVTTTPGPSSTDIRREISGISDELTECYIAGTFKDSQLAGTVKVTFTIDTDGKVSRAIDSGSDLADPEVVACVLEAFASMSFAPGGSSPTEVTYSVPFVQRG